MFVWPDEKKPGLARSGAIQAGWSIGATEEVGEPADLCGPCRFAPAKPMPDAPAAVPVQAEKAGAK
jgi:hypothetical protein